MRPAPILARLWRLGDRPPIFPLNQAPLDQICPDQIPGVVGADGRQQHPWHLGERGTHKWPVRPPSMIEHGEVDSASLLARPQVQVEWEHLEGLAEIWASIQSVPLLKSGGVGTQVTFTLLIDWFD